MSRPKIPLSPGDSSGAARRSCGWRQRPEGRRRENERGDGGRVGRTVGSCNLKIWCEFSLEHGSSVKKLLYSERKSILLKRKHGII